jgi:predicted ATPase/DNA-binding SARP family transcriptional activator
MTDASVSVSILGPVEARVGQQVVEIGGLRVRSLLARLALAQGAVVPTTMLIDAVWGEDPPAESANALQSLVSRLRRALGTAELIAQSPGGYRLVLAPTDIDAYRFEQQVRAGRRELNDGSAQTAHDLLTEALALWRSDPLPELEREPSADRLNELRLAALEDRLAADIAVGRGADVVADADALAQNYPTRERFTLLLIQAYGPSRQAEALAAYERLRVYLADQLGSDPSADLQNAHLALLRSAREPGVRAHRRSNLRATLTSFIGRDDEVARVNGLLESGRLVSVIGPGGAGKTRLAAVVATDWVDRMGDGVWFVELAPVTDATNLAHAVMSCLGLRTNRLLERNQDGGSMDTVDRLLDVLGDTECLLVVDNCEHLIAAVAALIDILLRHCPRLRVLSTTREPLGIDGESLCLLGPLVLPPPLATVDEASALASVRLFADRAAAVSAEFVVDDSTIADVIEIVRRLDGLPLAIELAAARLRVMPVAEIATRLSDRFRLLTGGSRTAMPRHRTLRAVVEWSWDLLTEPEQRLAERLAIFPSGATVDSAGAICADELVDRGEMVELLSALVDKSLLQVTQRDGVRYRMLETIREFGAERLAARGEIERIRLAHAHYFAGLVEQADPWLRSKDQLVWLRRLSVEQDNITAALLHLGESGDARATIHLAQFLGLYWTLLGSHSEAASWLKFALDVDGESDPRDRMIAEGLCVLNLMAMSFGDHAADDVHSMLDQLTEIRDRLAALDSPDPLIIMLRAMLAFFADDKQVMLDLIDEALRSDDDWVRATMIMFRGNLYENEGDVTAMRADTGAALVLFERIGDRWGLATTLSTQAQLHVLDGCLELAISAYSRAMRYMQEIGATSDEAFLHVRLSDLHLRLGNLDEARRQAALVNSARVHAGSRMQRMLSDTMSANIARLVGDVEQMNYYHRELSTQLGGLGDVHPMNGHLSAITLATLALLSISVGDLAAAEASLVQAHVAGVGTKDMPVLANVGGAVALWSETVGLPQDSAEILGASDSLRGAADVTSLDVIALTASLRATLGTDFDIHYERGRMMERTSAIARINPTSVRLDASA